MQGASYELYVVYGPSGIGKTALMLNMACAVANGKDFHGKTTQKANVLWIDFEMGEQLLQTKGDELGLHGFIKPIYNPESLERVQELIRKAARQGAGLVIIDSYSSLANLTGKDNAMNNNSAAEAVLKPLADLAHGLDLAIVVLHHTNKSERQYDGSQRIKGLADEMYSLSLNRSKRTLELSPEKHRYDNLQSLSIDAKDHPLVRGKDKAGDAAGLRSREEINQQEWLKAKLQPGPKALSNLEAEFEKAFGRGGKTVERQLKKLVKAGEVMVGKQGCRNLYSLAPELDRQTPPLNNPPVSVEDDTTLSSEAVSVLSPRQPELITA